MKNLIPFLFFLLSVPAFGQSGYFPWGNLHWKSPVASVAALPASGDLIGDARFETTGFQVYVWTGIAWQVAGGPPTAPATIGPFGAAPNNAGGLIGGNVLTLEPADGTHPGGVSTGTQTFGGNKTFNGTVTAPVSSSTATATNGVTSRTLASHFGDLLNVKDFGATGDGSTDDTNAINAAIASGRPLYWPAGGYLVTSSLVLSNVTRVFWTGEGSSSYILNAAVAAHPTLMLNSVRDFVIQNLAIIGQAGSPNEAIQINKLGGITQTANGILRNLVLQPNGNGIEINQSNTVLVDNVNYWSGNNGLPSSADPGQLKYAVYVPSLAGQFCNLYQFTHCNFTGVDPTISGATEIFMTAPLGDLSDITISDNELEGLSAVNISGGYNVDIKNNFMDDATITLNNTRNSLIDNDFNVAHIVITSGVQVMLKSISQGDVGDDVSIDSSSVGCGGYDDNFYALSDSGISSIWENLYIQGASQNARGTNLVLKGLSTTPTSPTLNIAPATTTNASYMQLGNAGSTMDLGISNSAGNPSGSLNYEAWLTNNTQFYIGINGNTNATFKTDGTILVPSLSASLPVQTNSSKVLVSSAIDLSGSQATGTMAAARMPALTGDVTSTAGTVATTVAKIQGTTVSGTTGTTNSVFSNGPTFSGTTHFPASTVIDSNGFIGIGASPGVNSLVISQSLSNQYLSVMNNTAGSGLSFGLNVNAGTNSSDTSLRIANSSGVPLLQVAGNGAVNISNLTASLPVQTDSSKNLISSAIDLSGSQATGTIAAGRMPALTGEVTNSAGSLTTTVGNSAVIGKVLTGYTSGAGTVAATDTILQAIQKLNGNNATNANLTGPITSVGNATSIASQTGTGTKFVVDTNPTLIGPALGTPTALVGTNITGTAAGLTAGTVTTNANLTGDVTSVGNATTAAATQANITILSNSAGVAVHGTNTNNSAAAGYVGEYIFLAQDTPQSLGGSSVTTDFAGDLPGSASSISLTAGDWDLNFIAIFQPNGASSNTFIDACIGTASGNNQTGCNAYEIAWGPSVSTPSQRINIETKTRVSISSTTSYFGKVAADYTGGPVQYYGILSARRRR